MAVAPTTDRAPVKPPEAPAPQMTGDCRDVRRYNWDQRTAFAICMAEAKKDPVYHPYGNPNWNNAGLNADGTTDYGLMQINSIHADMVGGDLAALYNPETNIKIAYSLSRGGTDWTPWSTYNNGKYRQFL